MYAGTGEQLVCSGSTAVHGDVRTNWLHLCKNMTDQLLLRTKNIIVQSFAKADGVMCVVVGTIAFGMGLDSPSIHSIIHLGTSDDSYVHVCLGNCTWRKRWQSS